MHPPDPSFPTPESEFLEAVRFLYAGLSRLYPLTKEKTSFEDMMIGVAERLDAGEEADTFVDNYVDNKVTEKKLAHLIRSAVAFAVQGNWLMAKGSPSAWTHIANAYFVAGMATQHSGSVGGALKKAAPFSPLKKLILDSAREQCPPEKWSSPADAWKAIAPQVEIANELLKDRPGYSSNTKAAFDKVVRENREQFESFLSRPIKRGRPAGSRSAIKRG